MTLPVSSSAPEALDLATINQVRDVLVRELRDQVCAWESKALDAGKQGDYMSATQYSAWAFACDLAVSKVGSTCSALFGEALHALPIILDTRTVELPQFHRSEQERHLDDLATELASHQACPEG